MLATRDELHKLVDRLPDGEIAAAGELLKSLMEPPFSDAFAQSIRLGISQVHEGKTTECRDVTDMIQKLLD